MHTYDETLFSDLHKDAYGFRPRGHEFYDASPERKQEIWDSTSQSVLDNIEADKYAATKAERDFRDEISTFIQCGAKDEDTALRWMVQDETFTCLQDVEGWVYDRGILFTDYGRDILEKLVKLVDFQS